MASESSSPEAKTIFSAYQETPQRRMRVPVRSAVLLLAVIGIWFALRSRPTETVVVTRWGMRTVRVGMTAPEVKDRLGTPIDTYRDGEAECLRYGEPTFKAPSFLLTSACYQEGKLKKIVQERYTAGQVDPAVIPRFAPPEPAPTAPAP